MKCIVLGTGSIGKRHLRNLHALGIKELAAFDPSHESLDVIAKELNLKETYTDFKKIPFAAGNVVYICSPNHLHAEQALTAANSGCDLFIEKPIAITLDKRDELCSVIEKKKLISLTGCNMRFYPAIQKIKSMLEAGTIGKVLSYRLEVAIYLPNWRPHLDYRKNYGAHKAQGGGAILDMIHEIDYARWLFGDPLEVSAFYDKVSDLEIDTEDLAEINLRHEGAIGNIHLDYLSHKYTRKVHVIGSKGNLFWDWHLGGVQHYDGASKSESFYANPKDYQLNQMYLDETNYFLDCVKNRKTTFFSVPEAFRVVEIALASKTASEQNRTVVLPAYKACLAN